MTEKFTNPVLIKDIERKIGKIRRRGLNPIKFGILRVREHYIEKEARTHSYKIEDNRKNETSRKYRLNKKHKIREGAKNIRKALEWGFKNFDFKTFDEEFIKEIGGRIDPEYHQNHPARYRSYDEGIRILGGPCMPPRPEKVKREMESYLAALQIIMSEESLAAVIEAAAFAHLHLVRIHPFNDTNGRTARTLQNIILKTKDLPPAIIYAGEKIDYYRRVQTGIEAWKERTSESAQRNIDVKGEYDWYNYIAGKVSSSLDRLLT